MEDEEVKQPNGKVRKMGKKDVSPVVKGYGIGLGSIKATRGSMYSCMEKIKLTTPRTHQESNALQKRYIDQFQSISQALQGQQSTFMVDDPAIDTRFDMDSANGLIKVYNYTLGEEDPIDISFADIKRFTNCESIDEGCALVELACNARCLTLLCVHDRYRCVLDHHPLLCNIFRRVRMLSHTHTSKANTMTCTPCPSSVAPVKRTCEHTPTLCFVRRSIKEEDPVLSIYYGVPLIDTTKLLGGIDCTGELCDYERDNRFFVFQSTYTVQFGSEAEFKPLIVVSKDPFFDVKSEHGRTIDCPDMCLVGIGHAISKGYFVRFVNPFTDKVIWNGYFNLSKPTLMMGSSFGNVLNGEGARLVRKRWAESGVALQKAFDPFTAQPAKEEAEDHDDDQQDGYRTPPVTYSSEMPKKPRKEKKRREVE